MVSQSVKDITSKFLYDQTTTPNKMSDSSIRAENAVGLPHNVSLSTFMGNRCADR